METDLLEVILLWSNCPWPARKRAQLTKQTDVPKSGSNQSMMNPTEKRGLIELAQGGGTHWHSPEQ